MKFIGKSYSLYDKDTHQFGVVPQSLCQNQNPVQDQDQDHDFTFFNTRPTFHT